MTQPLVEIGHGIFKRLDKLTPRQAKRARRIAIRKVALMERRDLLLEMIGNRVGDDVFAEIPAEELPLVSYALEGGELPETTTLQEVETDLATLERIAAELGMETENA
jgi:hypothetical protein